MSGRLSRLQFAYIFERDCKFHAEGLPVEGIFLGSYQSSLPFRNWPAPTQEEVAVAFIHRTKE